MAKKKFISQFVMILLLLIDLVIAMFFPDSNYENYLYSLSCWGVFSFLIETIIWKKMSGELLSPYYLLFCVATLYCSGQMFGWVFNLDMGHYDLTIYLPSISDELLYKGLLYSIMGLAAFHLGAISFYRNSYAYIYSVRTTKNDSYLKDIEEVAKVLFVVSLPAALYQMIVNMILSLSSGYGATYIMSSSMSQIQRLVMYPAEWFPICLIILYVCSYQNTPNNKSKVLIFRIIILVYLIACMVTGGRSAGVMFVISMLIAQQYLVKPIKGKQLIKIGIAGYLGLTLLSTISITRTIANRSIGDVMSSFFLVLPNAIGACVGELGWSMTSICWTMELIPRVFPFRGGLSYFFAFTAIIPNVGFWKIHPAAIYSNMGDWLQQAKGILFGIGYSFVAESYANFSWCGIIALFIFGAIISRLFNKINKNNARLNYKQSFFVIILIQTLMQFFIRSSFSAIMRDLVFTIGVFYLFVYIKRSSRKV